MSKPFAFEFDDDDIDLGKAEDIGRDTEPAKMQPHSPEIVMPQLHTLYELV